MSNADLLQKADMISEFIAEFFEKNAQDGVINEDIILNLASELASKFELTDDQVDDIMQQIISGGEGEEGEFDDFFPWGEGEFGFPFGFGEGEEGEEGFDFTQ